MTRRSVILGLLAAFLLCAAGYFNDEVMKSTFLVGNHLPISIFGGLVLFTLAVNPLLARLGSRWALRGSEIAVILALLLAVCFVPGRGLGKNWSAVVMLPWQHQRTRPGWQGEDPEVRAVSVRDWNRLFALVQHAEEDPPGHAFPPRLRGQFAGEARRRMSGAEPLAAEDPGFRVAALDAFNALVDGPSLFRDGDEKTARLPAYVRFLVRADDGNLDAAARRRLNRGLLDVAFAAFLAPRRSAPLESAPPGTLADPSPDENRILDGFVAGLSVGDRWISPRQVPWRAWSGPLATWLPLVFATAAGLVGLSVVVHRQWAEHEHLPYPIVAFARVFLPGSPEHAGAVRAPSFWLAAGFAFSVVLINYANRLWPDYVIPVTTRLDFTALAPILPNFLRGGGGWMLGNMTIYFTGIGIAYFLASDVSFSMGVGPFVYLWFAGVLAGRGISLGAGERMAPSLNAFMCAGAYFAIWLVLMWTGRHYYRNVLRRGLCLGGEPVSPAAVWGIRMFLLAWGASSLMLARLGLSLPLAMAFMGLTFMTQLVMGRLIAEAGIFYMLPTFTACGLLAGSFGARALGPSMLLVMQMATAVLMIDPSAAAMPFLVTGNGLAARAAGDLRGTGRWCLAAIALGILTAIPVTLYLQYKGGATQVSDWVYNRGSAMAWNANLETRITLAAQDALLESETLAPAERLRAVSPRWPLAAAFAAMAGLVLALSALRLRFPGWPIHPLVFAVWGTWHARPFAFSLLIGWLIKVLAGKFGGARAYRFFKPCMMGLIAGELAAALVPMVAGAISYFVTGDPPVPFRVRP